MLKINENSRYIEALQPDFSKRVATLCATDLDFVKSRLKKIHLWSEEDAESARKDFLRFVALTFVTTDTIVPSKEVDEFWHNFILFTRAYTAWCKENWGADYYLHHNPGHSPGVSWENTQRMVSDIFSEDWPDDAKAASCCVPDPPTKA